MFGHIGEALAKQDLLKGANTCKLRFCEYCIIGKKTKVRFGTTTHWIEGILDYVHTDVWGSTKTTSIRGNHYFMSFIDDYSRHCCIYHEAQRKNPGVVC